MLIYFSQTGNTQLLAQAIKKNVENSDIIYVGFGLIKVTLVKKL
mgnify:CR=1 FL=1